MVYLNVLEAEERCFDLTGVLAGSYPGGDRAEGEWLAAAISAVILSGATVPVSPDSQRRCIGGMRAGTEVVFPVPFMAHNIPNHLYWEDFCYAANSTAAAVVLLTSALSTYSKLKRYFCLSEAFIQKNQPPARKCFRVPYDRRGKTDVRRDG